MRRMLIVSGIVILAGLFGEVAARSIFYPTQIDEYGGGGIDLPPESAQI